MLEFGELVTAFQGELEVFRQGSKPEKGKSKAVVDAKGKGKEKASPSVSVTSTSAQPGATPDDSHTQAGDLNASDMNGGTAVDVEMRDASENGAPPNAVKSVTLPIE